MNAVACALVSLKIMIKTISFVFWSNLLSILILLYTKRGRLNNIWRGFLIEEDIHGHETHRPLLTRQFELRETQKLHFQNNTDSSRYNLGDIVSSPWEFVSLRVKWAEGLWVTEVNFDPEVLKVRGMVLASEGNRKCKDKSGKFFFCVKSHRVCACRRDTHLWRSV